MRAKNAMAQASCRRSQRRNGHFHVLFVVRTAPAASYEAVPVINYPQSVKFFLACAGRFSVATSGLHLYLCHTQTASEHERRAWRARAAARRFILISRSGETRRRPPFGPPAHFATQVSKAAGVHPCTLHACSQSRVFPRLLFFFSCGSTHSHLFSGFITVCKFDVAFLDLPKS